ncbi:unnamed protein product [Prorocentrum cordatum]|uniref:Uncharacterized protein n=1 Tax=Prorocentrum cordatum TaxID=2364126 RepID=A0ABN9PS82_9DINO|nr:unnamed protein product [Polarella glacialis]
MPDSAVRPMFAEAPPALRPCTRWKCPALGWHAATGTGRSALNASAWHHQERLSAERAEQDTLRDRLRTELSGLVESASDVARQNVLQVIERVDAVSQLIHSERNVREAAKQGLERQIENLRESTEADRAARRAECGGISAQVEETGRLLLKEARAREALGERTHEDNARLAERVQALSRWQAEKGQELADQVTQAALKASQESLDSSRELVQMRADLEAMRAEGAARRGALEEALARHGAQIEDLSSGLALLSMGDSAAGPARWRSAVDERQHRAEERTQLLEAKQAQCALQLEELRLKADKAVSALERARLLQEKGSTSWTTAVVARPASSAGDLGASARRKQEDSDIPTVREGVDFEIPPGARSPTPGAAHRGPGSPGAKAGGPDPVESWKSHG